MHNFTLGNVLYVDFEDGTDGTCDSVDSPCKYLERAMKVVKPNGKIFIIGKQPLTTTIDIDKNVSVRCLGSRKNAIITTNDGRYAFKILNWYVTVRLTCIEFKDALVVAISKRSSVIFDKCTVTGILSATSSVFGVNAGGTYLHVYNSKFINMTSYVV